MEIKYLIRLLWQNILYIVLGLVLGAGVGIGVTKTQTPVYEATTRVFVSRTRQQSNSELLSLTDEQLLAINLQLAKSQLVLNAVSEQIGSKVDADHISILTVPNTLLIQIKVQDTDPQRAATIANLLVQNLIAQNEALLSGWYTDFETAITEQIDQVQIQVDGLQAQISQVSDTSAQEQLTQVNQQIDQIKAEISVLNQDIASFPLKPNDLQLVVLAEKQAQLNQLLSLLTLYQEIQSNLIYIGKPAQNGLGLENPQLATLQATLALYKQINTSLITSRENVRSARTQSRQNVMQIVPATPPKKQSAPMPLLYFLAGSGTGLILAIIAILLRDHLDDSLKSARQTEELLGLPILGFVFENRRTGSLLVTSHNPYSAEAEAFRALGASLEITGVGKSIRTLMIVNTEPADAKINVAANIAAINAQQGKQVILLDGDLNRPYLHTLFGMENQMGFAELLNGRVNIATARQKVGGVEGMTLISSGIVEKESTTWLNAEKWEQVLLELQKQAELIIVDSPPADVADAQILASKMNAVLVAIRPGHTRVDSAQAALKRFQRIGVRVAGVVLINYTPRYQEINRQFSSWVKSNLRRNENPSDVGAEIDTPVITQSKIS